MEHKKKVKVNAPLVSALLLLEQVVLITRVYTAKLEIGHTEVGCTNCKLSSVKAIKKALSNCCPERFYEEVQVEVEVEYNNNVELTLQAFHSPKLGYIVAVQ
jgi:ferredoxin-like protein FixX